MNMNMNETTNSMRKFFGVVARGDTYLNIIYLLLAFPLGIAYFVFLVSGSIRSPRMNIVDALRSE
jgi:hypothetical protein